MSLRLLMGDALVLEDARSLEQSVGAQALQFAADLIVLVLILFIIGVLYYAVRQVQRRTIDTKDQAKLANVFAQYVLIALILGVPILSVWLILNLVTTTSPSSLTNLSGQATATALAAPGTATAQVQAATASARPPTPTEPASGSMNNANPTAVVAAATTGASAATTGASAATTAANASALGAVVPTPVSILTATPANAPTSTATPAAIATVVPLDGVFGPLDTGVEPYRRYLIAAFITLVTSLIEIFLILIYGAYFVNDPNNANQPLGLPPAAVRVFLIVVIVFVILVFTLLPDSWGSNKTTVLLIGLLTTVVGFYFGSKQSADAETATTVAIAVRTLTLRFDNVTIPLAARAHVRAHIVEDVTPLFQAGQPLIMVALIQNNGDPLANSRVTAALGRNDKAVEFNFAAVPFPNVETSYIVDVLSPPSFQCGDRLTFQV